jgi:hypothetical protein
MFIDQVESTLFGVEEDFVTFWRRDEAFELSYKLTCNM